MKLFMIIDLIVCIQGHPKDLRYIMAYEQNFLKCVLMYLNCIKHYEMNTHFSCAQMHVSYRIWYIHDFNLLTDPNNRISLR